MACPRILIIAGSDSSAGAGIQADLKTVSALGGYGMTAITAITAQNTLGVQGVHPASAQIVAQQINSCLRDIGADAIKIGMLLNAEIIGAVSKALTDCAAPIILDPVMVATSGDRLLDAAALEALRQLLPRANVITPNIPEAALLCDMTISDQETMLRAAHDLQERCGGAAIVLKGGHLPGETVHDLLLQEGEAFWYDAPRIDSRHTHGTGCTLASAIATIGAAGNPLFKAVEQARDYVQRAMIAAPGLGQGHGPLQHFYDLHAG